MDKVAQGHANRKQGFYGECVVQAIAAAADLQIARQVHEPDGIDFEILQEREGRRPRCKRIEIQVKTRANLPAAEGGTLSLRLTRKVYQALNGRVGRELDIPRFLVVVATPPHFSAYCSFSQNQIQFAHLAYWHCLMGEPDLPEKQDSVTVRVPVGNLLTPAALVALTCGDREEAARWMSA